MLVEDSKPAFAQSLPAKCRQGLGLGLASLCICSRRPLEQTLGHQGQAMRQARGLWGLLVMNRARRERLAADASGGRTALTCWLMVVAWQSSRGRAWCVVWVVVLDGC
jgi:hypothetical protein